MIVNVAERGQEVLFSLDALSRIDKSDIESLKTKARVNERERMRLCTHRSTEDSLHEMFIVHSLSTYVRPHKHLNRAVSHHIIEGSVDFVVFDDDGEIIEAVEMGDYASGKDFYYRTSEPHFYSLIIRSDIAVFHETITGPFRRPETVYASWSPDEGDSVAADQYMKRLGDAINRFRSDGS